MASGMVCNKDSKMCHNAGCGNIKTIKRGNRVKMSPAAAKKGRFKKCKACR